MSYMQLHNDFEVLYVLLSKFWLPLFWYSPFWLLWYALWQCLVDLVP